MSRLPCALGVAARALAYLAVAALSLVAWVGFITLCVRVARDWKWLP